MHVIATAGHVDHGKSSLVKALTGMDPDRLEEEKRRGLTIDLGFAWLNLPSGQRVGIVDVPGHERFIKNMLAGVGATDLALFVVAANEGWQPQSQEHLDILDLLGFNLGIVVITKTDLVNGDQLKETIAHVSERIQRTTLAGSPILPVSIKNDEGLPDLLIHLSALVEQATAPLDLGRPRLWVDRAFSIKGSGTVITGTLIEGSLKKDQEVEIPTKGIRARIRTIQSHQSEVTSIGPGNRTALNLVSVSTERIDRGDVLTLPKTFETTNGFVAHLRFLDLGFDPNERGSFKVYLGSAELDCSLTFIGTSPKRGGDGFAALRVQGNSTVASFGDRLILRDSGRRTTLAGGRIIEPILRSFGPPRSTNALARAEARQAATDTRAYLEVSLSELGTMTAREAMLVTGLTADRLPGVRTKSFVFSEQAFLDLCNEAEKLVLEYQSLHPFEPGIPRLQIEAGASRAIAEEIVEALVANGRLIAAAAFVRTPDHHPQTETPEALHLLQTMDAAGFSPPLVWQLHETFEPSLVRSLVREEKLVQIDRDIVLSARKLHELSDVVGHLVESHGSFTVAQFRDAVGTSRKYAVPLLEFLDSQGITRREGDMRNLGPALQTP